MPVSHTDAAKWSSGMWLTRVKHAQASGEGAVGVLFIWTDTLPEYRIPTAAFVVKPLGGSAASTKFAEKVIKDVVGADSPDSIELPRGSNGYTGVNAQVQRLVRTGALTPERAAAYLSAGSFVLQKMMGGYIEMSEAYKKGPYVLRQIVNAGGADDQPGQAGCGRPRPGQRRSYRERQLRQHHV